MLLTDHVVCRKGDTLTPEQARLLVSSYMFNLCSVSTYCSIIQKLLDYTMAEFKVNLEAVWTKDGSFEEIS